MYKNRFDFKTKFPLQSFFNADIHFLFKNLKNAE